MDRSTAEQRVRDVRSDQPAGVIAEPAPGGAMVSVLEPDGSGLSRYFVDDHSVYRVPSHCAGPTEFATAYPTTDSRARLVVEGD